MKLCCWIADDGEGGDGDEAVMMVVLNLAVRWVNTVSVVVKA